VSLDGSTSKWAVNQISKIQINAGAGNDKITLNVSPQLASKLYASGGTGIDQLHSTAKPAQWSSIERDRLISPPPATTTKPATVPVVYSGTGGPYRVTIHSRDPKFLHIDYTPTKAFADKLIADYKEWAARNNNGGAQDIVKITVEGQGAQAGQPGRISHFNVNLAVQFLDANAKGQSSGRCAQYVRLALDAGGIDTASHPVYARDYAPYLQRWGFVQVSTQNYVRQPGDVVVFQPFAGAKNPAGHIAMFDGIQWVSDFKQKSFFVNAGYRTSTYQIFRYGG
jgi:hypothetical protein